MNNKPPEVIEPCEFFQEYGYRCDREKRLREIGGLREDSLAVESANQIRHLKSALRELVSITSIHSADTGNNFAWAELEEDDKALCANE